MPAKNTPAKFWEQVKIGAPDECWEWQGAKTPRKYGQVTYQRKSWFAHRLALALTSTSFDKTLVVCHKCDNPPCCNPNHLFQGTQKENVHDMLSKRGHWMKNHPEKIGRGENHSQAKLTEEQARFIKTSYLNKTHSAKELHEMFHIGIEVIYLIGKGKLWKHI